MPLFFSASGWCICDTVCKRCDLYLLPPHQLRRRDAALAGAACPVQAVIQEHVENTDIAGNQRRGAASRATGHAEKPVAIDGDKPLADLSKQCQPVQDSPTGSAPSYALTDAGTAEPADRTVWRHRPLSAAFNSWFLWNGKIWQRTMWAGVHMCHGVRPVHHTRSGAGRVNWTDPGAHPYLWTWFMIHGGTQGIIQCTIDI